MSNQYLLEELQEILDKQLAWRKKELSLIAGNINTSKEEVLNTLIRAGISLLYAHWEGYIKIAAREYLAYLNAQECKVSELQENFLVLHLKKTIIDVKQSNKTTKFATLLDKINNQDNECFKVKQMDKDIISTESNLKFDVLKEILFSLGLEVEKFELKKQIIDRKLLKKRNAIAHGEYINLVDKDNDDEAKKDFEELYHIILELMDEFKEQIIDAGLKKTYLKVSS